MGGLVGQLGWVGCLVLRQPQNKPPPRPPVAKQKGLIHPMPPPPHTWQTAEVG